MESYSINRTKASVGFVSLKQNVPWTKFVPEIKYFLATAPFSQQRIIIIWDSQYGGGPTPIKIMQMLTILLS